MPDPTLLQRLIGWFGEFLEWAHEMLTGDLSRRAIIADLGGDPDAAGAAEFPPPQLASIRAYRDAAVPTLEGLVDAINDVRSFIAAVRSVVQAFGISGWATNDELVRALLDLLATNYVRLRYPRIYFAIQVLSFAEETTSVYGDGRSNYGRFGRALLRVFEFVLGPVKTWLNLHLADEADARHLSDRTLQVLAGLFAFWDRLGADDVLYGADLAPGQPDFDDPTAVDRALARMLTLKFGRSSTGSELDHDEAVLGSLAWVPDTQGGPALFMSLGGELHFDGAISERWHLVTDISSASAVNFLIGGDAGFKVHVPGAEPAAFRTGIALEARPDALTGLSYDLSPLRGTGIQFGLIRLEATFTEKAAQVKTTFRDMALTLSPKAFDSFLGRLLPSDGLRVGFDFAIGHASDRGSFLEGQAPTIGTGGANPRPPLPAPAPPGTPPPLPTLPKSQAQAPGLSLRIPIGKALGPVTLHDLQLGVGKTERTYLGEVTTAVSAKLGPIVARVERVGLRLAVRLPAEDDSASNLGLFDLDVGPRAPDGVAVAIDAKGVVTGGGFLFRDGTQQLYAGVMQLTLRERITLKAFGLLATRLPDGSPGYSLIVFITAEDFGPYPLGLGFMLRGIGGMLAVNRTFDQAAMREGLKNNTLANLLFPRDPIRRAPEILASLATVFPARTGSYLFGPLARITWGTPVMVVLELALILEFGNRTRLIVLGRISSLLPSRENDLVRLNVDAVGLIDFDEGRAELDAVLVDSRLAHKFVLTGAMAMRMRWSSGPGTGFALAVGGLNPHFAPPVGFPRLDRVTIALAAGDNPRITCAAYIAITSNTLQFGAQCEPVRGSARLQHPGRRRLRRSDRARAVPLPRRLPRLDPAQARRAQSVQGRRGRRAGRAAAVAGQRQGDVRDPVVRLLGAVRQDADQRRAAAAPAGGRCAGRTAARARRSRQLARGDARPRAPDCRRCASGPPAGRRRCIRSGA